MYVSLPKGIRERNGMYQFNVMHKGTRASGTASTLEEAIQARADMLERLITKSEHKPAPTKKKKVHTLSDIIDLTYNTRWKGRKAENSHLYNCNVITRFFHKDTHIKDITTSKVNAFVEYLTQKGSANGTINRKLSTLSTLIKTAEENDIPTGSPKIKRKKEYKGRERFISEAEEKVMLKVLEQWGLYDMRDAVIILIDTGIRCGELFRLRYTDIDFNTGKNGIITLWVTKSDRPRSVPITTRVRDILKTRLVNTQSTEKNEVIFPYSYSWLRQNWNRMRMYLGHDSDDDFVPHILRHTCASRLVQKCTPLPEVQRWMGHSSLQSTMRYSHLSPSSLFNIVDALEKNPVDSKV